MDVIFKLLIVLYGGARTTCGHGMIIGSMVIITNVLVAIISIQGKKKENQTYESLRFSLGECVRS